MSLFSCSFCLRAEVITLKISLLRRCYTLAFNLFLLPDCRAFVSFLNVRVRIPRRLKAGLLTMVTERQQLSERIP